MKKEKLNLYILFGCLGLTVLFAILTVAQMIKSFNGVGLIAFIVDIFALGVITSCLMQEKKEAAEEVAEAQETDCNEELSEENNEEEKSSDKNN